MFGFKTIILSRKGFDSSAGGGYSPFDPDSGKYIVLPIPQEEEEAEKRNPLKYEEIKIKNAYFKEYDASNLKDLIGRKPTIKVKSVPVSSDYAHFDPWLGRCPWLAAESNRSMGAFGQVDGAQRHLQNQCVGEGSLFLFFSRFKPINWTKVSKFNDIDISPKHLKKGLYFIYGWLKVGARIQKFEDIDNIDILDEKEKRELKRRHPHATKKYFEKWRDKRGKNTIYIADKYLFNDSEDFCGCGYFPKLTEKLLLTATDSAQEAYYNNCIATRWELPAFFYEHKPTYLKKEWRWQRKENSVTYLVDIPARGQEFVFKESEEFCHWLSELLQEIHK